MNRYNSVSQITGTCKTWSKNAGALLFAAILIVCSVTVGCSSDKPKPVSSNNSTTQAPSTITTSNLPAPAVEPAKPAPKKVAKKPPTTVTYTDKTYGVSFAYPRRYAIETGAAATQLVASSPLPMNFVQPGGIALAAVELPETGYANTDFSSAFFNVSVNKALTAEQCEEFSVPQPKPSTSSDSSAPSSQSSKLMLGEMELHGAETVAGEGPRQSDSKYFHIFQNGACYEFALNVTTNASELQGGMKHVDRDRVFSRLENILATVKIDALPAAAPAPETTAGPAAPSTPVPSASAPSPATPSDAASTPVAPTSPLPAEVTGSTPQTPVQPPVTPTPAAAQASPQPSAPADAKPN
jgi:hypothetical protein